MIMTLNRFSKNNNIYLIYLKTNQSNTVTIPYAHHTNKYIIALLSQRGRALLSFNSTKRE